MADRIGFLTIGALQCEQLAKGAEAGHRYPEEIVGARERRGYLRGELGDRPPSWSRTPLSGRCAAARLFPGRAGVGGVTTASALCIRDRFAGAGDLGTVGFAGLQANLRRPLPRSVLRCDLIHADMAAELALLSSGMTIPLSRAIFSTNDLCCGRAPFVPSPTHDSP